MENSAQALGLEQRGRMGLALATEEICRSKMHHPRLSMGAGLSAPADMAKSHTSVVVYAAPYHTLMPLRPLPKRASW